MASAAQLRVIHRSFSHDPLYGEFELLTDLIDSEFRKRRIASSLLFQQLVAIEDGGFPALDGYVHIRLSLFLKSE
jgi:hypothetical protein